MAVPKKKKARSKVKKRRANQKIKETKLVKCSKCNSWTKPGYVCKVCGTYKKRQVLDLEKRQARKDKKEGKEKEEAKE